MPHEQLVKIYEEIVRKNPAEPEFHQAIKEVLESLEPVVAKRPHYMDQKIIQRIA